PLRPDWPAQGRRGPERAYRVLCGGGLLRQPHQLLGGQRALERAGKRRLAGPCGLGGGAVSTPGRGALRAAGRGSGGGGWRGRLPAGRGTSAPPWPRTKLDGDGCRRARGGGSTIGAAGDTGGAAPALKPPLQSGCSGSIEREPLLSG